MFNQDEDWSDDPDAKVLSESVLKNTQKANSSTNVKSKGVGKKSLLRTLQTLGSVPEWKNDDHQRNSDSETEAAPAHTKKKKKRRKKRKQGDVSEELVDKDDMDQHVMEEKPATKKKKKDKVGGPKTKPTSEGDRKVETTVNAKVKTNKPENTEKLSRKQWKNKMKNKRNCKNKYRPHKPDEEVNKAETPDKQKPKEEGKTDTYSSNNNSKETVPKVPVQKKEIEHKPKKRKNSEVDPKTQTLKEEKQLNRKENEVEKGETNSPADGPQKTVDKTKAEVTDEQEHQTPVKRLKPELNKERSLKREKLRKMLLSQDTDQTQSPTVQKEEPAVVPDEVKQDRSTSLRSRMEQRLESARFRYINEVLYSTTSGEAKRMFKQDPEAFWIYHKGYTAQVQRWPANPVDAIIHFIQQKPSSLVVADFGCGDCKIAQSVKNKVHSFDFAATCELVTVCDMANVPLEDASVDIAVFCLSLMGTNLADFLAEANRVLKMRGILKIAEVASRFENARNFITALSNLGFKMVSKDTENTHFYSFEFVKTGPAPENIKKFGLQLKPCVYKKR
ncbi:ribosomal RNA-processing protein 8 [Sphaeramia orbicularis]|uniref:Ribosomal RNA-processing protein 8 n=1 Tax=Sphaeramia orbicularis TaxID=375764 RepID=A0A672YFB2_9TELE|nr:ribosomal RNA-processing protein 8 [Sphaeramia orbicularis]